AKSPGRRRRSSHALAPQHRATVTSVRGHLRGGRGNGSRTGEVGGAGDRDSGSTAARARWDGGSAQVQGDRAGAPGRHPHRVRRCPVSGRGHASRRVRLPDQTRRAGKGSRRRPARPQASGAGHRAQGAQTARATRRAPLAHGPGPGDPAGHPAAQAKLRRTLEERQVQVLGAKGPLSVDVRIIAAANVPMDGEIRAGRFRQDLYYRLNEFVIVVPALRERMEDIVYLAERFLAEASMELQRPVRGISDEGVQVLLGYHWPGNVRELRNVIRRAVLLSSDLIEPGHLLPLPANSPEARPVEVSAFLPPGLPLREMARMAAAEAERRAIRQALRTARGSKGEA